MQFIHINELGNNFIEIVFIVNIHPEKLDFFNKDCLRNGFF